MFVEGTANSDWRLISRKSELEIVVPGAVFP